MKTINFDKLIDLRAQSGININIVDITSIISSVGLAKTRITNLLRYEDGSRMFDQRFNDRLNDFIVKQIALYKTSNISNKLRFFIENDAEPSNNLYLVFSNMGLISVIGSIPGNDDSIKKEVLVRSEMMLGRFKTYFNSYTDLQNDYESTVIEKLQNQIYNFNF